MKSEPVDWWRALERDFNTKAQDIQHPYLETEEEAYAQRALDGEPKVTDPDTGELILGIPYRKGDDRDYLEGVVEETQVLIPMLREMFAAREPSLQFISAYGRFMECYGFISAVVMADIDDLKDERWRRKGAANARKDRERHWVAHLLARLLAGGVPRKVADHRVAKASSAYVGRAELPLSYTEKWFRDLVRGEGKDLNLVWTCRGKNLSDKKVGELAETPTADLPPVDIEIPEA